VTIDLAFIGRQVVRMQTDQRFMRGEIDAVRRELAEFKDELRGDIEALRREFKDELDAVRSEVQDGFARLVALLEGKP
jgi:hypothetical protein